MTFDICLHEVCVRVGVHYVITKFSRMDSLPNFLTHGAPRSARESSSITARVSMTLERQPVQSLSDHKIARTICVSQERANSRANEWSGAKQMVVPSYLEQARGGRVSDTEKRSEKYVLIKTIETDKEKLKEKMKKNTVS